jgi:prepilin peptidase CpaA
VIGATVMSIGLGVACVACLIAVFFDVRMRRIPNFLTLPLIALAPILALLQGPNQLLHTLTVLGVLFVGGLLLHRVGWLGGGDIKLAIGIGAMLGYPRVVSFLLCTGVAGGLLAVAVALARGRGALVAGQLRSVFTAMVTGGGTSIAPLETAPIDERIPYGLAIAAGLALTILLSALDPARFGS